ncbi:hypothetical protein [Streptomyces daqingensis]|uniref:hypothetical protein n=1 Tax=Streptomyces daqingensis TaxID=1472640 RepID=UPI0035716F30
MLTSAGLVLVTAVTVTGTARGLGPAWTTAFVLGSVLAPTDAAAVAGVAQGLARRMLTPTGPRAWSATAPRSSCSR